MVFANTLQDYNKEGMSLNFKKVEINEIFRQLAEKTSMNISTTENVSGEVSIFLNSVSFFEAIDILTTRQGLDYKKMHNTIIIGTPEEIEKSKKSKKTTKVYHLENVEPELIERNIKHLIDSEDTIEVNEKLSNILITTSEKNLKEIETTIHNLDAARRQIAVRVRFEEVSHNKSKNSGIDWTNISFGGDDTGLLNVKGVNIGHEMIFDKLQKQGATTTLANPRLTTIEGQKASLNIGDRIPVITSSEYTEEGKEEVEVDYQEMGIDLELTPNITSNNKILIDLKPKIEHFSNWVEVGGDRYPETSIKNLETKVEVKDGETIAIGGLIQHTENENETKIPLLNKIPWVGEKLFSYNSTKKDKRELIIFVTPEIINNTDYHFDGKEIVRRREHVYTVQSGDTFVKLGQLFDIPFINIMENNKNVSIKELKKGMNINVPIPEDRFYKIEEETTYKEIAEENNMEVWKLKTLNNAIELKKGNKIVVE